MRKRERENPCGVCGHYHKYEEGEVCSICGHRILVESEKTPVHISAFPSVILPEFLFLGSYDNASRSEILKTQGISRILNTVPYCQNLYKNSFTYHCLSNDKALPFDAAIEFLEQCEKDKARVLVHCMSGKNRSPAIVIAYLMKSKGWRLAQSYRWVKERRPSIELSESVSQQLQEYEHKLYGSNDGGGSLLRTFPPAEPPSISFGFSKINESAPSLPAFSNTGATSLFARSTLDTIPIEFTFGADQAQKSVTGNPFNANPSNPNGSDIQMDSS